MSRPFRAALAIGLAGALAIGGATLADAGGRKVLDASMAGLPSSMVSGSFLGAQAGGLPWSLERGEARLFADGRLQVQVTGLVLASGAAAGRNPVGTGQALVSCAGTVVAMSSVVPFSPSGDATVNERVDVPSSCVGAAVFFAGVVAGSPRWFAVTGW